MSAGIPAYALQLEDPASGRPVGSEPLAAHTAERLIAYTQLAGVAAGVLPNDGRPVRLDGLDLLAGTGAPLRVTLTSGTATFAREFPSLRACRDDAEVALHRLFADRTLAAGTYHFRIVPEAERPTAPSLPAAPLPRRLTPLVRRSLRAFGCTTMPRCPHQTIVIPRDVAQRLLAVARTTPAVEVGAFLVAEPFLVEEPVPCRWALRVIDAVTLGHGTTGTETALRVTPQAMASVPIDEPAGRWAGGLAHSHPFGEKALPHFLSSDDKAVATQWFWRPFCIQLVIDPRFEAPEEAFAAYCWQEGALARVCFALVDPIAQEDPCRP